MNDVKKMNLEMLTGIIALAVILLTFISSVAYYFVNDRILMAKNIETAISKGVDPLSVRCSYASGSDNVCVAYAISHGAQSFSAPAQTQPKK